MWISRKIASKAHHHNQTETLRAKEPTFVDRINKPLPPIANGNTPLTFVVVGRSNIGKSTFIRLALQNITQKQYTKNLQCYHTLYEFNQHKYAIDVIELDKIVNDISPIHGCFVCYDKTNKQSIDQVPDLLSFYLSRNIPTYLVGLKADLQEHCTDIVQQIVDSYDVHHFEVDAISEKGVCQMKEIFKSLVAEQTNDNCTNQIACGFVYAPTLNKEQIESNKAPIYNTNIKRVTSISSHFTASRRGSKDSSESSWSGSTVDDIIGRLLSLEYNKTDESIIPIFLIFYRRFMKPYNLVKILIEKFKDDGISASSTPSLLQKRIHSIFSLWLSHYWNDFSSPQSRELVIQFIDEISKFENYTPICDSLAPLIIREPPPDDPDKMWGLVDDELSDNLSCPPTPISPSYRRNEKKDSGYVSGTFSLSMQHSPLASPVKDEHFALSRISTASSNGTQLPIHRLARNSSYRRAVAHSESQPDLRMSYAFQKGPLLLSKKESDEVPRRAEFAGGLINIDNEIKSKCSVYSPSIATTAHGSRWTSSLGHQLASSFISTLRPRHSDKDHSSQCYKILSKTSGKELADQLTWIEAELFARIKPREFLRHIWNSNLNKKEDTIAMNTVLASIAHFNFISAWIVTMIISQSRLSKRVALLEKFMWLAVELRNHNNYGTLMAVLAAVNSAPILRLKQTKKAVENRKVCKQFQTLEQLMSSEKSFSSYRLALKASGTSRIPYLGIHNQDLVSIVEANKDFRADGTIHWEKFKLMGETIMATLKFKYPGYSIEPNSKLLTFIADSYILSEEEQYKRSTLIEPKLTPSTNNRFKDLWKTM